MMDTEISFNKNHLPVYVFFSGKQPPEELKMLSDYNHLLVVFSGQATLTAELATLYLETGDIAILSGGDRWRIVGNNSLHCVHILYKADFLAPALHQFRLMPGFRTLFQLDMSLSRQPHMIQDLRTEIAIGFVPTAATQEKRFSQAHMDQSELSDAMQLFHAMSNEIRSHVTGYEVILLSQMLQLMTLIARAYLKSADRREAEIDYFTVQRILKLLSEEYMKPWQLDDLCALAHMSKSKLIRIFHEATGKTPIECLIFLRLSSAMKRLRSTDDNIMKIAYDTGFTDSNYFSRQFRKYVGVSPRDYRRQK